MDYLFDKFVKIKEGLENIHTFLFLDYDGTLSAIADTPGKAVLTKEMKNILSSLSKRPDCTVAVISGRSIENIKKTIGLKNVIYAGNHGLEIDGPKIKFSPAISSKYRKVISRLKEELQSKISLIKGAFIEDKGLSLSLHYRLANKKQAPTIKTIFREAVIIDKVKNLIKTKPGKMVLEVRPAVEWNKGKAVLWLLARKEFALKNKKAFPIYIGDDLTDEDAFYALRNKGITIFVGRPKASYARYYLEDTDEVAEFLKKILEIKGKEYICQN